MQLDTIKNAIRNFLSEKKLKLFEVTYHKSDQILEVLLDEQLKMEELEQISAELSELLDAYDDQFADNYFLDVSTVGVERPIRNEEELLKAVGSYIYVKTKEDEYNGDLDAYEDGILHLSLKDKNRIRKIQIDYNDVKKVRYAVRF